MNYSSFKKTVWDYHRRNGRHELPWRKTRDPYKILVSEIMLQQTQVDRVLPKYKEFLKKFPTLEKLARAQTRSVLLVWQGLGYNRRAVSLKRTAEILVKEHKGKFPKDERALISLPGIGRATAGDLLAFAWNIPTVVIETNIRSVYIHHFFSDKKDISDKEITLLIEKTIDKNNPREWYYALMDYGSYLKKTIGNNAPQSKHYKKQSKFKGSNRELRSRILKLILHKSRTEAEIMQLLSAPAEPVRKNIIALEREGLIYREGRKLFS